MKAGNGLLRCSLRVSAVCGAILTAGTLAGVILGFAWRVATAPIHNEIVAGVARDSVIMVRITELGSAQRELADGQRSLARAMLYPAGSNAREEQLHRVLDITTRGRRITGREGSVTR